MNNRRSLLLSAGIILLFTAAFAQQKTPKAKPALQQKPVMEVALGRSGSHNGGVIPRKDFAALVREGIRIKDPQGAFIEGFSFTYGERNLYEDSAGNDMLITEYLTEYCMGDTLTAVIRDTVAARVKPGDTAYYDDIHIRLANGKAALGKSMKFVITR